MGIEELTTDNEYILEHYRALRERFTSQGNRLWSRFNFFLTFNDAIVAAIFAGEGINTLRNLNQFGPLTVIGLNLIWFIVGARDLWY